ncbi:MAG: hypothetical protein AB1521_04680 [Bacteroidota bacterium]
MNWLFINSGFNDGKFNMEFDIELARSCKPEEAYFRLYRWSPYCISLGANQSFNDVNQDLASSDKLDVVKRPTGGRAILHAEEITYSVIIPYPQISSAKEIYQRISTALVKGLEYYNPVLAKADLENSQPNFPKLLNEPSGVLCFGSTAKNEVKYNGKKLIGSAQRKLDSVILQHGSILCGTYHKKLVKYINAGDAIKRSLETDINDRTTEIETILNSKVDYELLCNCLKVGFESTWGIIFTDAVTASVNAK